MPDGHKGWRPLGLAFLYTGGALVATLGLERSSLGSGSKRELAVVGGAALVTGFVDTSNAGARTAAYAFQRINRKTNPGGTGEIDAPIQETVARVGLALAF